LETGVIKDENFVIKWDSVIRESNHTAHLTEKFRQAAGNGNKGIAQEKPLRIVFRSNGFKNDTAKTNVKQLLKPLPPETEMKVIKWHYL